MVISGVFKTDGVEILERIWLLVVSCDPTAAVNAVIRDWLPAVVLVCEHPNS